jgi:hypothetical protein
MSGSSLALAFDVPAEPMVLVAARAVAARLTAIRRVDRGVLNSIMATAFGGSDAEGRWSVRDAHAALELGQVLWLRDNPALMWRRSRWSSKVCLRSPQAWCRTRRCAARSRSSSSSSQHRRASPGLPRGLRG